ncbi:uncharacterized protein LOC132385679 [Hypanus sabinus]|uniref:uncharacterized protein LOC132385679 n=1 Tax=Hypanus sabinus TaxID=79690 RepID=UPI0028C4625C|nr:uncharacterized protein LOC132385679 [Hypanus sabinus]
MEIFDYCSPPSDTLTANQRTPLVESCFHWLRSVSGRDTGRTEVWNRERVDLVRDPRLGGAPGVKAATAAGVLNPSDGGGEDSGGDSVRCFSHTGGARSFPAVDRGLLSGVSSRSCLLLLGSGSWPAAAADGAPECERSPVQKDRLKVKGEPGAKVIPKILGDSQMATAKVSKAMSNNRGLKGQPCLVPQDNRKNGDLRLLIEQGELRAPDIYRQPLRLFHVLLVYLHWRFVVFCTVADLSVIQI